MPASAPTETGLVAGVFGGHRVSVGRTRLAEAVRDAQVVPPHSITPSPAGVPRADALTWLERVRIEKLTDAGYRQARILGRSPATISREMRRRETIVRPRPTGQGGAEAARRRDCCHRFAEVVNRRARLVS